eukprot:2987632-Alexandrium_andersonii.AAC.1
MYNSKCTLGLQAAESSLERVRAVSCAPSPVGYHPPHPPEAPAAGARGAFWTGPGAVAPRRGSAGNCG